jgi:thiosulfate/3-mercaptopyruvate sulfurtransferase
MNRLTTRQMTDLLEKGEAQVIDVRPVDAYNGWRLPGEARGGHIRGARSLPYKWLRYMDWIEIVRTKEILATQHLVVYGDEPGKTQEVADQFSRAGYARIDLYHHFADEWTVDEALPMQRLARYRHLVSAQWLQTLIQTAKAPEFEPKHFVICHAHYRNRNAYDEGHIPGAVELDTNTLESQQTWNRRSPAELKQTLEGLGIAHDTGVILYGRFSHPDNNDPFPGSSAGHLGAIRCAFIMLYAGVRDVRILNGGLQSWQDDGFAVETVETPKQPVAEFGAPIPAHPELAVDTPEARQILAAEDKNLVSVRSWSEYIGEVSGYNYIKAKGRIPGSVFGNCGSDAYHMENYRNLDHTMREYHEVETLWAEAGITPDKHNAFYCGTGWRGSEAFFNAWLMGWPRVSVYDGGWFEWSNDETNPYETGIPDNRGMTGKGVLIR